MFQRCVRFVYVQRERVISGEGENERMVSYQDFLETSLQTANIWKIMMGDECGKLD